jgi:hypothetical protein
MDVLGVRASLLPYGVYGGELDAVLQALHADCREAAVGPRALSGEGEEREEREEREKGRK